ncbi:hypothetical protein DM860_002051 [Cuscuta australis]|uniref:J domain-containing protein n=1 Tax=Cuscuta australis TaxID=267555 RepID=A0A328DX23_9ASTE|nr:hypothetical protein DM860_002051 [Cuscuta australis]
MKTDSDGSSNKELYALLNISPEASTEEIRKAYRQWAQVYHPDKYQAPQASPLTFLLGFSPILPSKDEICTEVIWVPKAERHTAQSRVVYCIVEAVAMICILPMYASFCDEMKEIPVVVLKETDIVLPLSHLLFTQNEMKDIATENFPRICEAYEILCDETKRQIYDIYGMEGLAAGLELGPKLNKADEIKEELERLRREKELEKVAHVRSAGTIVAQFSLPQFLEGEGIMKGMAMESEAHSRLSKNNAIGIGGNLAVNGNAGAGDASIVFRHQMSSFSSLEFMGSVGTRALIGVRTSRHLSQHSTASMGLAMSLRDGSIDLSNIWTRQLSATTKGNIQLSLGSESSVSVGWKKKEQKLSAAGEIKVGTGSFAASAHYTHHFSSKSHGCIAGVFGSTELQLEVGGGRKISEFSTVHMLYTIGVQGIFWKFELHRGGQKLIVPILLSTHLSPLFATGAFVIPASIYFIVKIQEAKAAAKKAQQLLETVANRKRNRQLETDGLVVTHAVYGSCKALGSRRKHTEENGDDGVSQILDVTLPMNFLVNDSGQLKTSMQLHEGVKKSGIMGFCDPCPDEPKQLYVEYMFHGSKFEVTVDDYAELIIPHEAHRIPS